MDKIYKWIFHINSPTGMYMRSSLASMPSRDIWIAEQDDDLGPWFLFSSIHLNTLDDPNKVYERAFKLKMLIDGVSYIIHENKNSYSQIVLGNLYDSNDNQVSFERHIDNFKFDFNFQSTDDRKYYEPYYETYYKTNIVSYLVHLAITDKFILNLLQLCSQGMDYRALYSVLDEIKTFLFLKGEQKLGTLGIDEAELNRFRHTVNSFQELGINARHGTSSHQPPKQPMTLKEAQIFMTNLIKIVLEKFYPLELPIIVDSSNSPINLDELF
jgi:hypothetical protein